MEVTINILGIICYALGWKPPDDKELVIGISMVAYLAERDPGNIFIPAAILHDARYLKGSPFQTEGYPRWKADLRFLTEMIEIVHSRKRGAYEGFRLECQAATLYLIVRRWGANAYEGANETN